MGGSLALKVVLLLVDHGGALYKPLVKIFKKVKKKIGLKRKKKPPHKGGFLRHKFLDED